MTTVADLLAWLEGFAPSRLAESWDNVGLLFGDPAVEVTRVMTCLTVTPRSADEAIAEGAQAIVSHHPVLFKATKSLRADRPETAHLWRLARAGVAILSPHTAFDNTTGGINDGLARRIGLVEVGPLRPAPPSSRFKVVAFAPKADREAVRSAAFAAGAGRIGAYEECSFGSTGFGTFFGTEGANPTIGEAGRREVVREWRLEFALPGRPARRRPGSRSERAHSYEEPAIDAYPLAPEGPSGPGSGRVGRLETPGTARRRSQAGSPACSGRPRPSSSGDPARVVSRVALCCGAGDDFLPDASKAQGRRPPDRRGPLPPGTRSRRPGDRPGRRRPPRHRATGGRGPRRL